MLCKDFFNEVELGFVQIWSPALIGIWEMALQELSASSTGCLTTSQSLRHDLIHPSHRGVNSVLW